MAWRGADGGSSQAVAHRGQCADRPVQFIGLAHTSSGKAATPRGNTFSERSPTTSWLRPDPCCPETERLWLSPTARRGTACGLLSRGWTYSRSISLRPLRRKAGSWLVSDVHVNFELADVHRWTYPDATFDVVVEIFAQFSTPAERALKWTGMRRALRSGGLLILQGYTPKQLQYATGGPRQLENLYTREMLEQAFAGFKKYADSRGRTRDARGRAARRHVSRDSPDHYKIAGAAQTGEAEGCLG
jgi:hypothetical protein